MVPMTTRAATTNAATTMMRLTTRVDQVRRIAFEFKDQLEACRHTSHVLRAGFVLFYHARYQRATSSCTAVTPPAVNERNHKTKKTCATQCNVRCHSIDPSRPPSSRRTRRAAATYHSPRGLRSWPRFVMIEIAPTAPLRPSPPPRLAARRAPRAEKAPASGQRGRSASSSAPVAHVADDRGKGREG